MSTSSFKSQTALEISKRTPQSFSGPQNPEGRALKVSQYFGDNIFRIENAKNLSSSQRNKLKNIIAGTGEKLDEGLAKAISVSVLEWALSKGVTHFCHWFQPLTGHTAEKHDSFLDFDDGRAIEKLSASQLMQGEPDASSFPNGGSRSTFEARGYTSWDLSSPIFIRENCNGKTLCIPTAFISYNGDALDIKTPLLRSTAAITKSVSKFLQLTGQPDCTKVSVSCGLEQEYFLVDKAYYYERPDLVMTGRTLFGNLTSRNQQLEDHYFGLIPERVLAFMNELEVELYKLGVPCKTRHNEVAPGQFETAPIFQDANLAADQNQITMAALQTVAEKHGMVCLLHEKPFAGINGSGKHCNWSLSDDKGKNLLSPGENPHQNDRFLAVVSLVVKGVWKHAEMLRLSIAGHGNDHRLGANEAPPSIISVFLGETLTEILESIAAGETYSPHGAETLDLGSNFLAKVAKDNTDRNRTSPFAFTGNKFEFRALGSSAAVGFPVSILNAAIADVFSEANLFLEQQIEGGKSVNEALHELTRKSYQESASVVFSGDGYSEEWPKEATKRGLPNLRTMADALEIFKDDSKVRFLIEQNVYRSSELKTRYNVLLERYIKHQEIEIHSLQQLISKYILPAAFSYKAILANSIHTQKQVGVEDVPEVLLLNDLNQTLESLIEKSGELENVLKKGQALPEDKYSLKLASEILPAFEKVSELCAQVENQTPANSWPLPSYYQMLFVR